MHSSTEPNLFSRNLVTRSAVVLAAGAALTMALPGVAAADPTGSISQDGNAVILALTGESGYTDLCTLGVWATNDTTTDPVGRGTVQGDNNATVAVNVPAGNYFAGWGCGPGPIVANPIAVAGALVPAAPVGGSVTQSGNTVTIHGQADATKTVGCELGVSTSNTDPLPPADIIRPGGLVVAPGVGSVDITWTLPNGAYYAVWGCFDYTDPSQTIGAQSLPPNATPVMVPAGAGGLSSELSGLSSEVGGLSSEVGGLFGSS